MAQSESLTGKPLARYWVHNGMVTVDGLKMSKSLGNFTTLDEILSQYPALVVRLFILSSHYRDKTDFSNFGLKEMSKKLKQIHNFMKKIDDGIVKNKQSRHANVNKELLLKVEKLKNDCILALSNDMDTPRMLSLIQNFMEDEVLALASYNSLTLDAIRIVMRELLGDVLGLLEVI